MTTISIVAARTLKDHAFKYSPHPDAVCAISTVVEEYNAEKSPVEICISVMDRKHNPKIPYGTMYFKLEVDDKVLVFTEAEMKAISLALDQLPNTLDLAEKHRRSQQK